MSSSETSDLVWFVKAEDQVFGPFQDERLPLFVAERRLSERTLVAGNVKGPFGPAGLEPRLRYLFEPEDIEPAVQAPPDAEAPAPSAALLRPAPVGITARARGAFDGPAASAATSVETRLAGEASDEISLLVVTELKGASPQDLRARLESFGSVDPVGEGAFLVTAPMSSAHLRNALSRGLGPEDRLMVVEVLDGHAAWFNLSADTERRLFKL